MVLVRDYDFACSILSRIPDAKLKKHWDATQLFIRGMGNPDVVFYGEIAEPDGWRDAHERAERFHAETFAHLSDNASIRPKCVLTLVYAPMQHPPRRFGGAVVAGTRVKHRGELTWIGVDLVVPEHRV